MEQFHQIGCFNINMKFWKLLAIWPDGDSCRYYGCYSKIFVSFFIILYDILLTINFYFLPRHLDNFIGEMIFYFTELAVTAKALTFLFLRNKIIDILKTLESDMFQPNAPEEIKVIFKAKKFNVTYWKIVAAISFVSAITNLLSPLISHLILSTNLQLPVCSYSFLPTEFKDKFIYLLYWYQCLGMFFHMLYNVNIDTFFLGIIVFTIAQIDILDMKLRNLTKKTPDRNIGTEVDQKVRSKDSYYDTELKKSIIHFDEVGKFCGLIQEVFSIELFLQIGMSSCIICVCLFRCTQPASLQYYIFLSTYMFIMIILIMVPCWFGTRVIDKSYLLTRAIYDCDWISQSRQFKSNLRFFMARANQPLSITGGKMFPLSLATFTSIMNSAYSFFTLLRHMESR